MIEREKQEKPRDFERMGLRKTLFLPFLFLLTFVMK